MGTVINFDTYVMNSGKRVALTRKNREAIKRQIQAAIIKNPFPDPA